MYCARGFHDKSKRLKKPRLEAPCLWSGSGSDFAGIVIIALLVLVLEPAEVDLGRKLGLTLVEAAVAPVAAATNMVAIGGAGVAVEGAEFLRGLE